MVNQLHGQLIILHMLIYFSIPTLLWHNKPNKSKNYTGISFITWFCRKSIFLGFQNSKNVQISKGSDNRDSNNQGSTVL